MPRAEEGLSRPRPDRRPPGSTDRQRAAPFPERPADDGDWQARRPDEERAPPETLRHEESPWRLAGRRPWGARV